MIDAPSTIATGVRHDRRLRLRGALRAPSLVQGIVGHRPQLGSGLGRRLAQALQRVGAVQARVVADHLARLQVAFQIGGHPPIDQIAHLEQRRIDLIAHLQGIAPVHEHGGLILEDHRRPGRAGKAGGPGQPVIGRRQVLVLMLVLVRG